MGVRGCTGRPARVAVRLGGGWIQSAKVERERSSRPERATKTKNDKDEMVCTAQTRNQRAT